MPLNEQIYLKCQHQNCAQAYTHVHQPAHLVALEADWFKMRGRMISLETPPEQNKHYRIRLSAPLKISLAQPFWVFYASPFARVDGLDSSEKLDSVRFCLVAPLHIYELSEQSIFLDVLIQEVKTLADPAPLAPPKIYWLDLLDTDSSATRAQPQYFEKYTYLDINIQGDLGVSVILPTPAPNAAQQIALNAWDFHLNVWYFYQGDLSAAQKKRFGFPIS